MCVKRRRAHGLHVREDDLPSTSWIGQEPLDLKGPIGSCFCANGAAKKLQEMPHLEPWPGVICTEIGGFVNFLEMADLADFVNFSKFVRFYEFVRFCQHLGFLNLLPISRSEYPASYLLTHKWLADLHYSAMTSRNPLFCPWIALFGICQVGLGTKTGIVMLPTSTSHP